MKNFIFYYCGNQPQVASEHSTVDLLTPINLSEKEAFPITFVLDFSLFFGLQNELLLNKIGY
jgi:hypothetical protein